MEGYCGHDPQADDDLVALNRRLDTQNARRRRGQAARGALRAIGRRVLQFYWLVCAAVVIIGLDAAYPAPGQRLAFAFADPALVPDKPFETCALAHANGYYSIPLGARAYSAAQDGDNDGRACEPTRNDLPNPMWRVRIIQDRVLAPW